MCAALLFGTASADLPRPLCRVQVSTGPHWLGRELSVTPRPGCPVDGVAYLRLSSGFGGSQPDNPPGRYTLKPGQVFRVAVLDWWHLDWQARSGKWWRVPEGQP